MKSSTWNKTDTGGYQYGDTDIFLTKSGAGIWYLDIKGKLTHLGRRATFDDAEAALLKILK